MQNNRRYQALSVLVAAAAFLAPSVAMSQATKSVQPAQSVQATKSGPETQSVLRVVPHANLTLLDPGWTSIYITRNHGYMIYDTLFAMDASGKPRPQMVDTWTESEDRLTWTFKLRDGLKWHDGQDVTAEDCVASLKRWAKRDGVGQQLFDVVEDLSAPDPKTIVMKLKTPHNYMLETLGQLSSFVPFMLPKRVAETDPYKPIQEYVGSGPFIFKQDEFVAGSKSVYVKNTAYVPRSEPPSLAAGGKAVKLDRVEWLSFPSSAKAVDALIGGKIDYIESLDPKFISRLEKRKDIVVGLTGPDPFIGIARFNHLIPPFNKPEIRRAVMMAMNQTDYMKEAIGPSKYWNTCYSVFPCKSPLATEVGSEFIKTGNLDDAKKALQAAGYDGTPVVILNATDIPVIAAFTKVTADKLRKIGMKVEVRNMDWATMASKRASRGPVSEGGWNLFHTFWAATDLRNPNHIAFSGDPENGWFGWPDDKELEKLRDNFTKERNSEEQKKIAAKVQERLWAIGASAHLGEFYLPVAYRKNVEGVIVSPVQFYWEMSVKK
jgi:peptide/nickel transport system substrate-binding protein